MKKWYAASPASIVFVIGCSFLAGTLTFAQSSSAVIEIDPSRTFQTMTGWEVSAHLWEGNKDSNRFDDSWRPLQDEIFDRLINEMGVNRIRIEIRSGAENPVNYWAQFQNGEISYKDLESHYYEKINDNDDPHVINPSGFQFAELDFEIENILLPMLERLQANGEKLYINLCYVDFRWGELQGTLKHAKDRDEYAELIFAAFKHMKDKYGLTPDALEVILEPDNTNTWRGREIGRGAVAAVKRLNAAGYFPDVIAPSTSYTRNAAPYFDKMIRVKGMKDILTTLSYHRYDNWKSNSLLPGIASRVRKRHIRSAMLELVFGGVDELYHDLVDGQVSAWQQWAIATNRGKKNGYYYTADLSDPEHPVLRMTPKARRLAQYFHFVRMGAVRIGAITDSAFAGPVAFKNPDGSHIVIVRTTQATDLVIKGMPSGRYGVRVTTDKAGKKEYEPVSITPGASLTFPMPDKGVITFYQLAE